MSMKRIILAALAALALFIVPAFAAGAPPPPPFRPLSLAIDSGIKVATSVSGAATLNKSSGVITTAALSTAAGATFVLTLTNSKIAAADQVFSSVQFGTSTTGTPAITSIAPAAGSVVITVQNVAAAAALNGTLKISYMILKN
jgi:hypothetical protein